MAYQVLARKYRPQRFADVAGQDHVTVTLMNALAQNRIAHGYIFSGHRGIGKTTIARILAMALNCRNSIGSAVRPSPEPCEVCESCTEIRAGNSVDVIEIDAATNRGIDEIRATDAVAPSKDVDGFHPLNAGHLYRGRPTLVPATALGVMALLDEYRVELEGARAVIVGRSDRVGKPLIHLLLARNATNAGL